MQSSRADSFRSTAPRDILNISHNIISECEGSVSKLGFRSSYNNPRKQSTLPSYIFDPKQPNPLDQSITNKYLQKLKSNAKRMFKNASIRKSELGENQLVFTPQEQLKLQVVDQFLQKGFELPDDVFHMQLYPKTNIQSIDLQNANKTSMVQNPFEEELSEWREWGNNGNKSWAVQTLNDFHRQHVDTIDLGKFDQNKKKKRKQCKLLNFHRVYTKSRAKQKNKMSVRERVSLTVVQPNKSMDRNIDQPNQSMDRKIDCSPIVISQNPSQNHLQKANIKKFPSIEKEFKSKENIAVEKLKKMQKIDRLNQVSSFINNKFLKTEAVGYMTKGRIQALYDCQMIKGVKQIMTKQDYVNLEIELGVVNEQKKKKDETFIENIVASKKYQKQSIHKPNEEIQKIIQKNKKRLKVQRQRVIEKLRC